MKTYYGSACPNSDRKLLLSRASTRTTHKYENYIALGDGLFFSFFFLFFCLSVGLMDHDIGENRFSNLCSSTMRSGGLASLRSLGFEYLMAIPLALDILENPGDPGNQDTLLCVDLARREFMK